MLDSISYEDVIRDATRTGEALKAALYYMAEVIDGHNDDTPEEAVDIPTVIRSANVKFIKPSGGMINGFMGQFGVLFVQVVPSEPNGMLGHILEQGYHVIPNQHLQAWKSLILDAHADAIASVCDAYSPSDEEDGESMDSEGDDTPTGPAGEEV